MTDRTAASLTTAAEQLRSLHTPGQPLVLVNVWDVASARQVEAAGAPAIATASAAMAASLGVPDDPTAPVDLIFSTLARIVGSASVPVTADLLDGYGLPAAELVDRLLATGAVGCNIEDSDHSHPDHGHQVEPSAAADRIAAVRAAASESGVPLVVNARVDNWLRGGDADPDAEWDDVVTRARLYLDAGADCVYPIRLADPAVLSRLYAELDAPINANPGPDGNVAAAAAAGAARLSIGPMALYATLSTLESMATSLLGSRP